MARKTDPGFLETRNDFTVLRLLRATLESRSPPKMAPKLLDPLGCSCFVFEDYRRQCLEIGGLHRVGTLHLVALDTVSRCSTIIVRLQADHVLSRLTDFQSLTNLLRRLLRPDSIRRIVTRMYTIFDHDTRFSGADLPVLACSYKDFGTRSIGNQVDTSETISDFCRVNPLQTYRPSVPNKYRHNFVVRSRWMSCFISRRFSLQTVRVKREMEQQCMDTL